MPSLLERLEAVLADRYVVEEEVGRGGMAVVFRARDLRHHRRVAIKVLHPELSAAVGADRFLHEVDAVAGLTHPHILPLFDSGQAERLLFYIMPFVEGESLRQRLDRVGQLSLEEAISITKEVANALDHAHRHGLVHRDIKPGNILLSDGHAFVTDFGVARALNAAAGDKLTRTGLVVGTPSYMSPEQAGGDEQLDSRSDVYALGCVLYEMLAGEVAFTGATPQTVIARQMTRDPTPIRQVRHDVPPGIEEALTRALEKEPDDRFQSCEEFGLALNRADGLSWRAGSLLRHLRYAGRSRLQGRPLLAAIVGAAVLFTVGLATWMLFGLEPPRDAGSVSATDGDAAPSEAMDVGILHFEDFSEDGSLAAYAAGFTKEIIRRLNAVEGLAAPSYTAVRRFRGTTISPDSLASALSVELLAEGAVLPTEGGVQVDVDLVDPRTGRYVGSIRQRAPFTQLTDLIETVTDSLALALRPELGQQVRLRKLRMETSSDSAMDLVWRAEEMASQSDRLIELEMPDRDGAEALLVRADSLLFEAHKLDPSWTEPLVQKGWVAHRRAKIFTDEPQKYGRERMDLAREGVEFADRALELREENAEALELRGTIRYGLAKRETSSAAREDLLAAAEQDLRRSVEIDDRGATAWRVLGDLLQNYRVDLDGAKESYERALRADRFLEDAKELTINLIDLTMELEDYGAAWQYMRQGRRRWPEDVTFPYVAVMIMASDSNRAVVDRAWAYADTVTETMQLDRKSVFLSVLHADVSAVLALAGLEDSAQAVLDRTIRTSPDSVYPAYNFAHAHLVLGDTTGALRWLEVDLEAEPGAKARRASEPWFGPLHGHPEFEALVREAGEKTSN